MPKLMLRASQTPLTWLFFLDALYALGMAYLARGDDAAARRHLEAFLAAKPEFEVATEVQAVLADMAAGKSKGRPG